MAFRKYVGEPTRREFNRNHPVDLYEVINSAKEKATSFLHKRRKKGTQETSWCSHTGGIRADLGVLRAD